MRHKAQRHTAGHLPDVFEIIQAQRQPHAEHRRGERPKDPRLIEPQHGVWPKETDHGESDEPDGVEIVEPVEESSHGSLVGGITHTFEARPACADIAAAAAFFVRRHPKGIQRTLREMEA